MEFVFYETLEEVHNKYVELWKKGVSLKVNINQRYGQLYVKDEEGNVQYTNNALNSLKYSKLDLKLLNQIWSLKYKSKRWNKKFVKDFNKALIEAIRGQIKKTPKNDDWEIDQMIRQNVILPASTLNKLHIKEWEEDKDGSRKYTKHENVFMIDENSCYFSGLTKFGDIAIPDPIVCYLNDFPEDDQFLEGNFYSFRINMKNPRVKNHDLFPLAQPSHLEDEGIASRGKFGTELETDLEYIEAVVNVYYKGDKIINEFSYLEDRYHYDDIEFVSGFQMKLTDEYINFNSTMMSLIFKTLEIVKKHDGKESSKIYAQIQQLLKTTLGWSFTNINDPKETMEVKLTVVDPYTVVQEQRINTRMRKYSNHIFITPILYTIVNNHIRSWQNVVPYRYHIKDTADAMFITEEGYIKSGYSLKFGDEVGQFKFSYGHLRQYDAKLWVMYNSKTLELTDMAHGGLTKDVKPYLKTLDDWENRHKLAAEHVKPKLYLEDLFEYKRYIHELIEESYENKNDYSKYEKYNGQTKGKIALLGGQGTGKTTSIVKALDPKNANVLHLFFNRYPAYLNKDIYQEKAAYKRDVRTIDSMVFMLYHKGKVGRPNYKLLRRAALNNLGELKTFIKSFDYVVIDEIQSVNGDNRLIVLEIMKTAKNYILAGDFNQEWKKNYRRNKPFTLKDITDNVDHIYKLDVNYRNSKIIFDYGNKILNDGSKNGNENKGIRRFYQTETQEETIKMLKDYQKNDIIIISRHNRIRRRLKEHDIKTFSVSDTKSTNPEKIVLVNSLKLGLHEKSNPKKEYEAIKEIWSALLRPKNELIIIEYEGWK